MAVRMAIAHFRCRICGEAGHHANPLRLIKWPSVWQHCYVCLLTGFEVEDKEEAKGE